MAWNSTTMVLPGRQAAEGQNHGQNEGFQGGRGSSPAGLMCGVCICILAPLKSRQGLAVSLHQAARDIMGCHYSLIAWELRCTSFLSCLIATRFLLVGNKHPQTGSGVSVPIAIAHRLSTRRHSGRSRMESSRELVDPHDREFRPM